MPIYVYSPTSELSCVHCQDGFERIQKMSEPPLATCPECGAPVEKLVTSPNLSATSASLKDDNLQKHGFTKYRRLEKGVYEKTAGRGPEIVSSEDSDQDTGP